MSYGRTVAAALVAALLTAPGASADPAPPETGRPWSTPDARVTLLTGDRVVVEAGQVRVEPGAGRSGVAFARFRDDEGDLNVVPTDVAGDLASGRLDERLFDVGELVRSGHDDRTGRATSVIVTPAGARVAGATGVRPLPSIDGYATTLDPRTPSWPAARATAERVWLDGRVGASLDRSVPAIGAPAAWRAGLTGRGTRVAVLDTGIDASHPDLAGAVVGSANFSAAATTDDLVGHGTHVAATITGSGAYQGVAPDAELLNGKVLDDDGYGSESSVIAGMEWAAERADVVNMSLGGQRAGDGEDPMSLALDRLSARTGALFVVSAGNRGPAWTTVGSPGAADAALTVGAVDRDDAVAGFSSRGPRLGDDAVKPDITAPGVDIVAARARGAVIGTPVGDGHLALSGTSMAAPHVAGAAALLAQQHPDWTAERLKGVLTGSASPSPGASAHEQGSGRVDVARAVEQAVHATPTSLGFGLARWPQAVPLTRVVTFHNAGDRPRELAFAGELRDEAGAAVPLSASPDRAVVPAGGAVEVAVTADPSRPGPAGRYSGAVVATGDGVPVRVPVALDKEEESHDVALDFLDSDGNASTQHYFRATDLVTGARHDAPWPPGTPLRLPVGTYAVEAFIDSPAPPGRRSAALFAEPALRVDADAALVFDARDGRPAAFRVDEPNAAPGLHDYEFRSAAGPFGLTARAGHEVLLRPSRTSAPGRASFTASAVLGEPDGAGGFLGSPYQYHVSWSHDGGVPADPSRRFRDRDLAEVRSTAASTGPGRTAFRDFTSGGALPLRLTERYSRDRAWSTSLWQAPTPDSPSETTQNRASPRTFARDGVERWNRAVFGPAFPDRGDGYSWATRRGDELAAYVRVFTDQAPDHVGDSTTTSARTTLTRDGALVGEWPTAGHAYAVVPPDPARYALRTEATRDVAALSTSLSAEWTFTSGTEPDAPLPLLAVRFAPDLDDGNRAPRGRFAFPVYVQRNGEGEVGDVRSLRLEASRDDGATWRAVPVLRTGERWVAVVDHRGGPGFVSLRARAVDRAGNGVEQTIVRAYAVK